MTDTRYVELLARFGGRQRVLTPVCAWCPDADQKTRAALARGEDVTHTLCPSCAAALENIASEEERHATV